MSFTSKILALAWGPITCGLERYLIGFGRMHGPPVRTRGPSPRVARFGFGLLLLVACGGEADLDGAEIDIPFDALAGGVLFATRAIVGSNGYDLYLTTFPSPADVSPQPFVRVLDAPGDQWQPAVSRSGRTLAFASDSGIFLVTADGVIRRLSDSRDTTFVDSLPALSADGAFVAWVREDENKPIAQTGFFEAAIWIARTDGTELRALEPRAGVVQDAPVFSPSPNDRRIAWTEFAPESIVTRFGPTIYGVYVYDHVANSGSYPCRSENGVTPNTEHLPARNDRGYRCFGQHMDWPAPDTLVLTQDLLEVSVSGTSPLGSSWDTLLRGVQNQQLGTPFINPTGTGFFPAFPISAHYVPTQQGLSYVFDGVVSDIAGDNVTLGFFLASGDGSNVRRLTVQGLSQDLDSISTANFLFSRATPRIVPFPN